MLIVQNSYPVSHIVIIFTSGVGTIFYTKQQTLSFIEFLILIEYINTICTYL